MNQRAKEEGKALRTRCSTRCIITLEITHLGGELPSIACLLLRVPAVWLRPIDPGYFFNPLGEGTLPWVFRRGTGNPPNRVQTPLKQAPEGRGETTKPGATAEPAARRKSPGSWR